MDYLYKEVGNGMNNDAEMRDREQIKWEIMLSRA